MSPPADLQRLKQLLRGADPQFWAELAAQTRAASRFDQLLTLSSLRKRALKIGVPREEHAGADVRLALVGGCSLYPASELVEHCLDTAGIAAALFSGDYDNYVAEIADPSSDLYAFGPDIVLLLPAPRFGNPSSGPLANRADVEAEAKDVVGHLLELCRTVHERARCEVLLANFPLPARRDPGGFRTRTLASEWSFRKLVNLELGLNAPGFVQICDLEFGAHRIGGLAAHDDRGWFESKQPGSPALLVELAREVTMLVDRLRHPPKKVLVLDLDNTLWGGVIGDDGLEGIEIGDTSPRGEAFKAFQHYVKSLTDRGVLLAVCSKNDHDKAVEPFEKHPEMVLRMDDFSAFTANWDPKADNIRRMAAELNLGLDSFVFVDDNAAEIEIVRQFAPEVTAIHLGDDPAEFVGILQDCRQFEPRSITADDTRRTEQYRSERERKSLEASAVDMDAYLCSLEMTAEVHSFRPVDVPRLAQLINKSNQFNLTTRRRTEAEVTALIDDPEASCFSVRLSDRFGDHGLIAIVVGRIIDAVFEIDTWLMSCRVLKRQVEEEVLNEIVRRARERGCARVRGVYIRSPKNNMVSGHYPGLGFATLSESQERGEYELACAEFEPRKTHIRVTERD